jgi:hypothetical protein
MENTSFGKIRRLISVKKAFDCTFSASAVDVFVCDPSGPDLLLGHFALTLTLLA